MKELTFVILILLLLTLACKSSTQPGENIDLSGTWKRISIYKTDMNWEYLSFEGIRIFQYFNQGEYFERWTWEYDLLDHNIILVHLGDSNCSKSGTASMKGDTLFLLFENETFSYELVDTFEISKWESKVDMDMDDVKEYCCELKAMVSFNFLTDNTDYAYQKRMIFNFTDETLDFYANKVIVKINSYVSFVPEYYCAEIIDSIFWNFGDGNTSYENFPSYKYDTIGLFDVTLRIKCKNSDPMHLTKENYIQVVP
jgi:hypothetical protein